MVQCLDGVAAVAIGTLHLSPFMVPLLASVMIGAEQVLVGKLNPSSHVAGLATRFYVSGLEFAYSDSQSRVTSKSSEPSCWPSFHGGFRDFNLGAIKMDGQLIIAAELHPFLLKGCCKALQYLRRMTPTAMVTAIRNCPHSIVQLDAYYVVVGTVYPLCTTVFSHRIDQSQCRLPQNLRSPSTPRQFIERYSWFKFCPSF